MKLLINIKPTKYTGVTKSDVMNKVTNRKYYTMGNDGSISYNGYKELDGRKITVMNLHKVRRKVIQKKGKDGKTKSKVLSKGHWVAYVYTFDIELLKAIGIKKLNQNSRNFDLISK